MCQGWTPLMHACARGADVIPALVIFPDRLMEEGLYIYLQPCGLCMPGSGSGTSGLHCRDWCSQLGAAVKNLWTLQASLELRNFNVMPRWPRSQDGDTALQITQRRRDPADVVAVTKVWVVSVFVDVTFWSVDSYWFALITWTFENMNQDILLDGIMSTDEPAWLWVIPLYPTYFTSLWGVFHQRFIPDLFQG